MSKEDKIKLALIYCADKRCDECFYNRWTREFCQKHLCKDTLTLINKLEHPTSVQLEQLKIDI